jgi:CRISPR/Cas system-associated exonuclease Cas4 (RecB family)
MPLPATFAFSQASLQAYTDCPRRFQLRYVLGVRWPIAREDSISRWEQRAQLGAAFHQLVHQHTLGLPKEALIATIDRDELHKWWSNYLRAPPPGVPSGTPSTEASSALRLSEVRLTTPLAGYRVMARYDLLAIEPGKRAVIVDWKTNERRPKRAMLEKRWQTRVYRYVLVTAGSQVSADVPLAPDRVEVVYWFANYPTQPERFPYDGAQYAEDEQMLRTTIAEIASRVEEEWTLTDDLKRCRYCAYRTLCDREKVEAGEPDWNLEQETALDADAFDPLDIDLEQIAEIEF